MPSGVGSELVAMNKFTTGLSYASGRRAVPGHSAQVTVPSGRMVRISFTATGIVGSTNMQAEIHLGSVSGTTNRIAIWNAQGLSSSSMQLGINLVHYDEPGPGTYTYVAAINDAGLVANASYPSIFTVELV